MASCLHANHSTSGWKYPLPRIVGGVMKVHPITILVLLLLSSNIYGVIGMIVAVPTYSILKEISKFLSRLYENHKTMKERERELAK